MKKEDVCFDLCVRVINGIVFVHNFHLGIFPIFIPICYLFYLMINVRKCLSCLNN